MKQIYSFEQFVNESVNIKTAGVFLFNSEGKLLVCKPSGSNLWSIPKGQQDPGEDTLTTAKREMYEETNIDMNSPNITLHKVIPLPKYKYTKTNKTLVPYLFYATFTGEIDLKCNSFFTTKSGREVPEMEAYKWVSLKKAAKILHEAQVRCIIDNMKFFKLVRLLYK